MHLNLARRGVEAEDRFSALSPCQLALGFVKDPSLHLISLYFCGSRISLLACVVAQGSLPLSSTNTDSLMSWLSLLRSPSLQASLALALGTQATAYALSTVGRHEPTEIYYDISGSATHLAIVSHVIWTSSKSRQVVGGGSRVLLLGALSSLWTVRLGAYLFERVSRTGGDSRFDDLKRNPATWVIPWTMQAFWCTAMQAPLVIAASARKLPTRLTPIDAIGAAVFLGGFILEAVADFQKDAAKKAAPLAPVTSGVFSLCVYPHYFGEITLWCGAAALALPAVSRPWHVAATLLAPALSAALLLGVSGVPLAEASAWRKYGSNEAWVRYRAETNMLIPWWPQAASGRRVASSTGSGSDSE